MSVKRLPSKQPTCSLLIRFPALLPVTVHDGVKSVGDGDDRAGRELCPDGVLDEFVCLQVDGGGRLVQNQDLGLVQQSAGETHQLTLTNTVDRTQRQRCRGQGHTSR